MIRFRITGYGLYSPSLVFYGTNEVTFMISSVSDKVFELKMSAFQFYKDVESSIDEDFQVVELL